MAQKPRKRRTPAADDAADFPFTMKMPDGRALLVELPGRWVTPDRDGAATLKPEAVAFLDRVQAAFQSVLRRPMTPAYMKTLREALGLTQVQFAEAVGVDGMSVSRWERGQYKPGPEALEAIEHVRKAALRRGVAIPR